MKVFSSRSAKKYNIKIKRKYNKPVIILGENKNEESNKGICYPQDWVCDLCNKPESEVGNLSTGRTALGRDFQICDNCLDSNGLNRLKDIDEYYETKEENK